MDSPNVCIGRTQDFLSEGRGFDIRLGQSGYFWGDVLHICFMWIGEPLLEKNGLLLAMKPRNRYKISGPFLSWKIVETAFIDNEKLGAITVLLYYVGYAHKLGNILSNPWDVRFRFESVGPSKFRSGIDAGGLTLCIWKWEGGLSLSLSERTMSFYEWSDISCRT